MVSDRQFYQKQLKDLRHKLAAEQMSLLVGSGLSKNVSAKFLTWDELLVDLAYELNQRAVNTAYERYLTALPDAPISLEEFKKAECLHLIRQQGYLEIVSEYIRRKGIAESITTYIEERIPGVYRKADRYFMDCNGEIDELPREKLNLHKNLIDLPWNNIYTTNYDDLLDICVDEKLHERLTAEVNQLEVEISDLVRKIREKEVGKESLNRPSAQPEMDDTDQGKLEGLVPQQPDDLKVKARIEAFNLEIRQLNIQLEQKELLVVEKSQAADNCYKVVKTAEGLRIKKRKNIIKLHGSLRSSSEKADFIFEFDGDPRKQYVISKEDYETYPTRHEAFTQLMRISLLQESFCLIGFSGIDPNFLQWISWVRGVLFKAARLNKDSKRYKIYLMDVEEGDVSRDKQLFYENHNIVRIPLRDPAVVEIFREDLGDVVAVTDRRSAIEALIAYLGNDDHVKSDLPTPETSIRTEHKQLWNSPAFFNPDKIPDEAALASMLERLAIINKQLWLPDLSFGATHNQHTLLGSVNYTNWRNELPIRPQLRRLVVFALQDMAVPIRSFLDPDIILELGAHNETQPAIEWAISRNDALSADLQPELSYHDEALRLAYTFQFEALRVHLDGWPAKGRELIAKAGLFAIIDRQVADELLSAAINEDIFSTGEEKLYALELLHHISQPFFGKGRKRISRLIRAFERSGYRALQDSLEDLQKEVAKKEGKTEPYGAKRFERTRTLRMSKHSDAEAAVQLIMLLAESGFQLCLRNIYLLSSGNWYPVMKAGFEFYPFPFLFYSLQFNNKDFLKTVGQDYAFSDAANVAEQLPGICGALFTGLLTAPENYANNIQVFLSSLVVGVRPEIWQMGFENWWRNLSDRGIVFRSEHDDKHPLLINAAIQYISDTNLLITIITDCLSAVLQGEENQPINFLYFLNRNQYFRRLSSDADLSQPLQGQLDEVINGLDTVRIARIFVLGNLFRLLSTEQLTHITEQLLQVDFGQVSNARIWRVLLHFANGQPLLGERMRQALIVHENLWYTGIDGDSITGGLNDEPIPISSLSYSDLRTNGLIWEDKELKAIFEGLKVSLNNLERLVPTPDGWFSFTSVLEEMVDFLTEFRLRIQFLADYEKTLVRTQKLLDAHRNYSELEEGLSSRDQTAVLTALKELDTRVYHNNFNPDNITLLLNKILLQAEPAVEASLGYVAVWLNSRRYPDRFREQEALLVRILRKYEAQPLENSDLAYVEDKLTRIAWLLKTWGNQDPIVSSWLKKADESRFNNVHQFMASVENGIYDQD